MKIPEEMYSSQHLSAAAKLAIPDNPQIPDGIITAQRRAFVNGANYARDFIMIEQHAEKESLTDEETLKGMEKFMGEGI